MAFLMVGIFLGLSFTVCFFLYFRWKLNHFKRRSIPFIPGYPVVGNNGPILTRSMSPLDLTCDLYKRLKGHRFGGTFQFNSPLIMIRDPELIKQMLVKDSDYFVDRGIDIPVEADVMFGGSLFNSKGEKWKALRTTLSPAFTSSKIKIIFRLICDVGNQMTEYLHEQHQAKMGDILSIETQNLWKDFTNDVIVTSGFGVQCNSFKNPDNQFSKISRLITDFSGFQGIIFLGFVINWRLMKFIGASMTRPQVIEFLNSMVKETLTLRECEGIVRPDIMQLLIMARRGELDDEGSKIPKHKKAVLDDTTIASMIWNFFFAGVDTTTTLLTFATNKLAVLDEVQRKAQAEIDEVLEEDGELTYEGLNKLKFLDMILSETLRLFPSVPVIDRKCLKRYVVPATPCSPELIVEKGDVIQVNIAGIHKDPEYFPDPEKFHPERFSEENKSNIKPFTFLPFGVGPRICIGQRMALMEAKVALFFLLSQFDLHVVDKTPIDIKLSKKQIHLTVDGGLWVGLTPRLK